MTEPRINRYDGERTETLLDALADVYQEVYAEPPYNSGPLFARAAFMERTKSQTPVDGFTLITAETEAMLAGFSFGFSLGTRWWGGQATPPPPEVQGASKFAVIELVVRKQFRGTGLGRTLLTTLLEDRPEEYATLLSVTEAPAHDLYVRWGWYSVGSVQPRPDAPIMDALVLKRR
jgi:GNAT superfamily N-acetyltransferase